MLHLPGSIRWPGVPPSGQTAIIAPQSLAQVPLSADRLESATLAASPGALHLCRGVRTSRARLLLLPLSMYKKLGWWARLQVSMCRGDLLCVSPLPKGQMPGPTSLMMTFRADLSGAAVGAGAGVAGGEVNCAVVGGDVEGTAVDGAGL